MTTTMRTLTILSLFLFLIPTAAADPLEDPAGAATRCAPPQFVQFDAWVTIKLCAEASGLCVYDVIPERWDAASGGSWGTGLQVTTMSAPGYTTVVQCEGFVSLRTLQYGTENFEPRWASLRLGHLVDERYISDPPAAREATKGYIPGGWAVLELELDVAVWQVIPDAVPLAGPAAMSVPVGFHNTAWLPSLSVTGGHYGYYLDDRYDWEVPLIAQPSEQA